MADQDIPPELKSRCKSFKGMPSFISVRDIVAFIVGISIEREVTKELEAFIFSKMHIDCDLKRRCLDPVLQDYAALIRRQVYYNAMKAYLVDKLEKEGRDGTSFESVWISSIRDLLYDASIDQSSPYFKDDAAMMILTLGGDVVKEYLVDAVSPKNREAEKAANLFHCLIESSYELNPNLGEQCLMWIKSYRSLVRSDREILPHLYQRFVRNLPARDQHPPSSISHTSLAPGQKPEKLTNSSVGPFNCSFAQKNANTVFPANPTNKNIDSLSNSSISKTVSEVSKDSKLVSGSKRKFTTIIEDNVQPPKRPAGNFYVDSRQVLEQPGSSQMELTDTNSTITLKTKIVASNLCNTPSSYTAPQASTESVLYTPEILTIQSHTPVSTVNTMTNDESEEHDLIRLDDDDWERKQDLVPIAMTLPPESMDDLLNYVGLVFEDMVLSFDFAALLDSSD